MAEPDADWEALIADLRTRREETDLAAHAGKKSAGGADARARLAELLDEGSLVEIGRLAGSPSLPSDAFVAGHGTIDGRPVLVGAEEFGVAGGSIGVPNGSKRQRLTALARQESVPLVLMLEGAGHRATNTLDHPRPAPNDLQGLVDLDGQVPVITLVTGPSAGHGALAAPLSDLVLMVEEQASLFTAGPPVVKASLGEQVSKEELGGARVHAEISGVAHNVVGDVSEGAALIRRFLALVPHRAGATPRRVGAGEGNDDDGPRRTDALTELIPVNPRRPYRMADVLDVLLDAGTLLEIQPAYGASLITALGRLGGHAVAVIANEPSVAAGAITAPAAEKAARFIRFADDFGIPLCFLADTPGMLAGRESERAGVLRAGGEMFRAQHRARVPKLHVTVRKAFGFGSSVMAMNPHDHQTVTLALPNAMLGGVPAAVGGRTAKEDPETQRALIDAEGGGPWRVAASGTYDDVVEPGELRDRLLAALELAGQRRAL